MRFPTMWLSGWPRPKGSWVPIKKRDGNIGFRPANNETAKWQRSAEKQLKEQWGDRPILNEPVRVELKFFLPKRKTVVREYPVSRMDGDGDKLERCIWDALTDVAIFDDSLVVDWTGSKRYVALEEEAGVFVTISTMEASDEPPNQTKEKCHPCRMGSAGCCEGASCEAPNSCGDTRDQEEEGTI